MCAKILVVDDSAFSRRRLRQALEPLGHSIEEAADGMQALERFYMSPPDLVLLDLVMPGMYGPEVLAKLREMNPNVPVIIATSDVQMTTKEELQRGGARALLNKPVDQHALEAAVNAALAGGDSWT